MMGADEPSSFCKTRSPCQSLWFARSANGCLWISSITPNLQSDAKIEGQAGSSFASFCEENILTEGNEDNEGLEQPILSQIIYQNHLESAATSFRKTL
jgi:hypothetical protein